ncbi:MAG: radical SAM protein [Candidatus Zophobacter franzmannii]|nr:radical SAM protein [Candidatus Zophobacter franzmannii]
MITLFLRTLLYKMYYTIGFPRMLPMNYTVSLLYTCNSRCATCNIWKKTARNLSDSEYGKIFKSVGKSPYWITFSGGEPFLRKDIVKVVSTIYKTSKPKIMNFPSNGILTKKIVADVKNICRACPKSQIIVNLSIDGIEEEHNRIRKVEYNFQDVIKTYRKLKALEEKNLQVGIHTVISKFNVHNFSAIASYIIDLNPDSYITEIAEERVELGTMRTNITPNLLQYKSAIDFLIHRIKHGKYKGMSKITQAFRVEYYNLVKKILRDETQVIPCYSGVSSVQISPEGDIWSCCIKAESMGSLRDNDYKFKKIWYGKEMKMERKSIKNKSCWCPLANASYTNMLLDTKTLARVFYRVFIKWYK